MTNLAPTIEVSGRVIGQDHPPFVIAELSACHNGSLENALTLVELAKSSGADAIKIQTYRPDTITIDCDAPEFRITEGSWAGTTLYDLYEKAHTPWEWHAQLFERAAALDIPIFSSPFDHTAVDFLTDLGVPAFKVASFELVDLPLIAKIASTRKPMIMSTGMASLQEIEEAVSCATSNGATEIALLHCVSGYPAPAEDYQLKTIEDLRQRFGIPVGLSDHSTSSTAAIGAVSLGARLLEKHLTLDRNGGGPDDHFAIEPDEFNELCQAVRQSFLALGSVHYGAVDSEKDMVPYRRSLYVVRDIASGEPLTEENIRSIRPGNGLPPKHLNDILGRRASCDLTRGTALSWNMITEE